MRHGAQGKYKTDTASQPKRNGTYRRKTGRVSQKQSSAGTSEVPKEQQNFSWLFNLLKQHRPIAG